mgnify:CR=1 FL=1
MKNKYNPGDKTKRINAIPGEYPYNGLIGVIDQVFIYPERETTDIWYTVFYENMDCPMSVKENDLTLV